MSGNNHKLTNIELASKIGTLQSELDKAAKESSYLREKIKDVYVNISPTSIPAPLSTLSLTIIPERLQFPDPSDPALHDGSLYITIRILIKGLVIASQIIDEIDLSEFKKGGAFVDLKAKPFHVQVQPSEDLKIEVLVGKSWLEKVDPELVRFEDTLYDDPSGWIGSHSPGRSQLWRLWYRVAAAEDEKKAY
jgi:hypothetical protein